MTRARRRCSAALLVAFLVLVPSGIGARQGGGARPQPGAAEVAAKRHDGVTARDAMPGVLHLKNVGGSDGSGLCVFASIAHSGRYQKIGGLADLMDWMRRYPGGGWPEKVDAVLRKKLGAAFDDLEYVHVYGPDALPVLQRAVADGLLPCVSYGFGERYGVAIDHMVNLVHLDDTRAAILDNNFPGDAHYEWMSREEFERRFQWGSQGKGEGWAIIFFSGDRQPPEPEG